MAPSIKHKFVSPRPDGVDTTVVRPSNWNDEHDVTGLAESGANVDITSLGGVTGGISSPTFVQFDTLATELSDVGKLYWDDTDGTLSLGLKGGNVVLQLGQETLVRVTNATGSAMSDGQIVYITGSTGSHVNVTLAQANSEAASSKTLGMVAEGISPNQTGFVNTGGLVRGIDTSHLVQGGPVWLSATVAGGTTSVRPVAPLNSVLIGWCVRKHHINGVIFVAIANGYELNELHDVLISGPVLDGSTIIYDNAAGVWRNNRITAGSGIAITNGAGEITITATGGSGGASSLAQLTDVSLSNVQPYDVLSYNPATAKWVNERQTNITDGGNF